VGEDVTLVPVAIVVTPQAMHVGEEHRHVAVDSVWILAVVREVDITDDVQVWLQLVAAAVETLVQTVSLAAFGKRVSVAPRASPVRIVRRMRGH
jgi:hypothetical protein